MDLQTLSPTGLYKVIGYLSKKKKSKGIFC